MKPKVANENGSRRIMYLMTGMGSGLKILCPDLLLGGQLHRVRARGGPSPIPIFPGNSQVHSLQIPCDEITGTRGAEEMKLDNQTISSSRVRRVDFGDYGPMHPSKAVFSSGKPPQLGITCAQSRISP